MSSYNFYKSGVAILISDKVDFKTKAIKRDTEGHFIILKGRNHQEDINIISIYAPNIGTHKYIRKILEDFKKDIDSNTLILGNFNTPLSKRDRSSKQNIKDIEQCSRSKGLKRYISNFSYQSAKYRFFTNTYGTFSTIDHMIHNTKQVATNSRKLK